ncbi:glycosyltransferase family 39 protein [Microbacterium sp. B19]|uniref:glycosyltransferase family 39 protein n=1 Tax=Microbacterium sp. B19 TaxID=96765 RepID=UPI0003B5D836|nr:glycosyltransferase family 39 protein [Microbacterium sp. B19]
MTSPVPLARWWREPWWARLTLLGIVVAATVLMTWNLSKGGDFSFYEAAARSMSESWHAMLFGAFDPASTITLDKLSGFAVPQALAIDLFGMSTSSVALPQVVEGIVTILACAVVGLRWGGRGMGLVAAAAAASTPIFVSMFGHPMEDGLLTMALAVALVWWQRATLTGRWWPLLVAGLFIGVGFQAKMMSAWFVLPGLVVATALATVGARRAWGRATVLIASAVTASVAWMAVVSLVPPTARPFVDGSTNDDVFAMVFGYNGLDRLIPDAVAGAVGSHPSGEGLQGLMNAVIAAAHGSAHAAAAHATAAALESYSPTKLIEMPLVTQIGWLYPAALAAIAFGIIRWWPRRAGAADPVIGPDRAHRALFIALVLWTATSATVLSAARVPHTAYVAALGVPLALLTAFAWGEAVRWRSAPRLGARLAAPVLLAAQGGWWTYLSIQGRMPLILVTAAVIVWAAGLTLTLAALARPQRTSERAPGRRVFPAMLALAMLCGPIAFSSQVVDAARDGDGGDAYVGVRTSSPQADEVFHASPPTPWGGTPGLNAAMSQLVAQARKDGGGTDGGPLFVSDSWAVSGQVIAATGQSVLTDGGYSGDAVVFRERDLRDMIAQGHHLFVVTSPPRSPDPVRALVKDDHCRSEGTWDLTAPKEGGEMDGVTGVTLYSCS